MCEVHQQDKLNDDEDERAHHAKVIPHWEDGKNITKVNSRALWNARGINPHNWLSIALSQNATHVAKQSCRWVPASAKSCYFLNVNWYAKANDMSTYNTKRGNIWLPGPCISITGVNKELFICKRLPEFLGEVGCLQKLLLKRPCKEIPWCSAQKGGKLFCVVSNVVAKHNQKSLKK